MNIQKIKLSELYINPDNIRKQYDISDLIESINNSGILIPLLVTKHKQSTMQGEYMVVDGNRRLLALQQIYANGTDVDVIVPCIIQEFIDDKKVVEHSLITALQREELSEREKVNAFKQLSMFGLSEIEIAKSIGKPKKYVKENILKSKFSDDVLVKQPTMDELVMLSDFPDNKQLASAIGTNKFFEIYETLNQSKLWEQFTNTFTLPIGTMMSSVNSILDINGYTISNIRIRYDGYIYIDGVKKCEYKEYTYPENCLIFKAKYEYWVLLPGDNKQILKEDDNSALTEEHNKILQQYQEIKNKFEEHKIKVIAFIKKVQIPKEPLNSLLKFAALTYENIDSKKDEEWLTNWLLTIFEYSNSEPFYIDCNEIKYRKYDALDLLNALNYIFSEQEREILNYGE